MKKIINRLRKVFNCKTNEPLKPMGTRKVVGYKDEDRLKFDEWMEHVKGEVKKNKQ